MPRKPSICPDCGGTKHRASTRCRPCAYRSARQTTAASRPDINPTGLCLCGCGNPVPLARSTDSAKGHVKGRPVRYLSNHHHRGTTNYVVDTETGCWVFAGKLNPKGYGPHRRVYVQKRGPVPPGLELDHTCRNRACINPDHLEPVSHAENVRRGERPSRIGQKRPKTRWSRCYDMCIDCGKTTRLHAAHGRCTVCHRRMLRRESGILPRNFRHSR